MHSVLFNFPFLCKHGQCAYLCIWVHSVNLCLRLCVTSLCCVCSPVSKDRTVDQCAVLAQQRDHRSAMCSTLTHVRLMMKSDKSLDRLFSSLCLLHWRHVLIALFRFTKKYDGQYYNEASSKLWGEQLAAVSLAWWGTILVTKEAYSFSPAPCTLLCDCFDLQR